MNLAVLRGIILAGGVLAILWGLIMYRRLQFWGPVGRVGAAFLPLLAYFGVGNLIMELVNAPHANWNSPRLAPTFALWHGYAMYYGPDSGPVLGNIYGPGLALAYLPCVMFPLPSLALKFGVLLTSVYYFLPVVCLHWKREERDGPRWVLAGLSLVWFLFMTTSSPPLSYVAFSIHADAPAIGLCGLACVSLYARNRPHTGRTLLPAALCSILAVWTKQTMVPILFALPLYLWLSAGRRTAQAYLGYLLVCLGLISGFFVVWLGVKPWFFNTLVIPSHHPWYPCIEDRSVAWVRLLALPGPLTVLLGAAAQLARFLLVSLGLLLGYFIYGRYFSVAKRLTLRAWLATQPWVLPALVGLCMVPTSLLGRVKVGGDTNTLSCSSYFICAAASLLLVQVVARIGALEFRGTVKSISVLTFCTVAVFTVSVQKGSRFQINRVASRKLNVADQSWRFVKAHPGECYFPWDPLVHLMAEGKLYHFCYGVFDRELAGYPLSEAHTRDGLPPQLKLVVLTGGEDITFVSRYLPEFSRLDLSFSEELPYGSIYVRK